MSSQAGSSSFGHASNNDTIRSFCSYYSLVPLAPFPTMAGPLAGVPLIFLLLAIQFQSTVSQAVEAQWSTNPYGPDGPWNVVEMGIGLPGEEQLLSFFPGTEFQTFIPTTKLCAKNRTMQCFAAYNEAQSKESGASTAGVKFKPPPHHYSLGLKAVGENMRTWVDEFLPRDGVSVKNGSMALMDQVFIEYPNGQWYPPVAGCLAVGGDAVNQTFEIPNQPPLNASVIPGYLWENERIESNSFAMHIGSASPPISGSLVFGGYDQDRVAGDVLELQGNTYRDPIILEDLAIEIFTGDSPFNFADKKTGLLADGNSSLASGLTVRMDGCSPYLTLPESTCKSLSNHLPILPNPDLGLYTWNVSDERYFNIMNSASGLTFNLSTAERNGTVSISVPFQHLNLTLDKPLVQEPTPYFPCSTALVRDYILGRAFLQDAFVGAGWNDGVFWLAQAPGPDGPHIPRVVGADTGRPVKARDGDWISTWKNYWSNLEGGAVQADETGETSTGLSTAAKAGIGVGVGLGVIMLIVAVVFLLRRRRKKRGQAAHIGVAVPAPPAYYQSEFEPKYLPELHPNSVPAMMGEGAPNGFVQETWSHPVEVPATPVRMGHHQG